MDNGLLTSKLNYGQLPFPYKNICLLSPKQNFENDSNFYRLKKIFLIRPAFTCDI